VAPKQLGPVAPFSFLVYWIGFMNKTNGLSHHIQYFLVDHRDGWNHDDWLAFLHRLEEAGEDTSDPESIGAAMERAHLQTTLEHLDISGLGPKRIEALTNTYGSLGQLQRTASVHIADETRIPVALATRVLEQVR
jgi:hypothetical protein